MNVIRFDTLSSTNTEAKSDRYRHGDVIVATCQTDGRGQRGHRWSSRAGENLTFSIVVEPRSIVVGCQFLISEAVALAIGDTLAQYEIDSRVKWTNDIYADDCKICGILIENTLEGDRVARSIIGIGLNVNQTEFDPELPNPTSMKLQDGSERNVDEVLDRLCAALEFRYAQIETDHEAVSSEYNARLYRRGENRIYALPDGDHIEGSICRVEPNGRMILLTTDGERSFAFKEIEFIL